jgi:hypothetical protein
VFIKALDAMGKRLSGLRWAGDVQLQAPRAAAADNSIISYVEVLDDRSEDHSCRPIASIG